jgi:hypothetical protein
MALTQKFLWLVFTLALPVTKIVKALPQSGMDEDGHIRVVASFCYRRNVPGLRT